MPDPAPTCVFTEFGRMFFDHFAALLDRPDLRVEHVVVSPHSAHALRRFLGRGAQGEPLRTRARRARRLVRYRDVGRWRALRFLKRHRDRVVYFQRPDTWRPRPCAYACSLGFMRQIPPSQLRVSQTTSNLHESLLPDHAGCGPVYWALRRGDPRLGVTLHELADAFDRGPILAQAAFDVAPHDTAQSLAPQIRRHGHRLLRQYLADRAAHHARATAQPADAPPPAARPADDDHRLDLAADPADAWSRYRAAPQASVTLHQGHRVRVAAARPPGAPRPGRRWQLRHGLWTRTQDGPA